MSTQERDTSIPKDFDPEIPDDGFEWLDGLPENIRRILCYQGDEKLKHPFSPPETK